MNINRTMGSRSKQGACSSRGFTLIELMISLTVSLIMVSATIILLIDQQEALRHVKAMARIQENGRFANDILVRNIRMSRYDDKLPSAVLLNAGIGISGQDSPGGAGRSTQADTIFTNYEGGAGIRDCLGRQVNENETTLNEFFINDVSELRCTATHYDAVGDEIVDTEVTATIAEGIEDMQFIYGEDVSETGLANRFVVSTDVTDWSKIVSVRVALLVNSVTLVTRVAESNCTACMIFNPAADRRTRAEFTASVGIRNVNI